METKQTLECSLKYSDIQIIFPASLASDHSEKCTLNDDVKCQILMIDSKGTQLKWHCEVFWEKRFWHRLMDNFKCSWRENFSQWISAFLFILCFPDGWRKVDKPTWCTAIYQWISKHRTSHTKILQSLWTMNEFRY